MLCEAFPQLEKNAFVKLAQKYFSSVFHLIIVGILTLVSALFALEVPVFYCYLVISVLAFFLCDDAIGLVPVLLFAYTSLSYQNNPFQNRPEDIAQAPLFSDPSIIMQIGFCAGVVVLLLLVRTFYNFATRPKHGSPRLWLGFVLLAAGYFLGGAFTKYYGLNNVIFSMLNIVCIAFLYFAFRYAVDWKKRSKDYIFYLLCVLGAVVMAQIIAAYFREGVVVDGVSLRWTLGTGWGHYNTVGCVMAMCACAPLYFAATKKHGWLFTALAIAYMVGVLLSQSRGSILFGAIVFVIAFVYMLVKAQKKERFFSFIVIGVCAIAVVVLGICFFDKVKEFFESMLKLKADPNGRLDLFREAWGYFLSSPVFGAGWGGENWYSKGNSLFQFFMAHNTVMQLLGSFGIVGTLAYGFHRVQTCILVFKHRSVEKFFCAFSVLVLLLTCMMDVHIFSCNAAVLLYSGLLAFMEGCDIQADASGTRHSEAQSAE